MAKNLEADYIVSVLKKPNGNPLSENNSCWTPKFIIHRATSKLDATGMLLRFIEEHPFLDIPERRIRINQLDFPYKATEPITTIPYEQVHDFSFVQI